MENIIIDSIAIEQDSNSCLSINLTLQPLMSPEAYFSAFIYLIIIASIGITLNIMIVIIILMDRQVKIF